MVQMRPAGEAAAQELIQSSTAILKVQAGVNVVCVCHKKRQGSHCTAKHGSMQRRQAARALALQHACKQDVKLARCRLSHSCLSIRGFMALGRGVQLRNSYITPPAPGPSSRRATMEALPRRHASSNASGGGAVWARVVGMGRRDGLQLIGAGLDWGKHSAGPASPPAGR